MSMRGYDAWLTTDRMAEAHERDMERIEAAWEGWTCTEVEDGGGNGYISVDAIEDDHPQHAVYVAWLALFEAVQAELARQEAEAEAEMYRAECEAEEILDTESRA
jgi:hypothetical protein